MKTTAVAAKAIDPVCGMTVDPAAAAGHSEYAGETYYFCSGGCQKKFDAAPAQYAAATTQDKARMGWPQRIRLL